MQHVEERSITVTVTVTIDCIHSDDWLGWQHLMIRDFFSTVWFDLN